ncbi:MAG: sporulation protein YabP [Clostridia bacterium]|nr:sporulation protein YabP [Clostridia bacterium]
MAMNDEQKNTKTVQNIILENRRKIAISGVIDVDSFDEHSIILLTDLGILEVNGTDIKIEKLNLENGEISASGEFDAIEYVTDKIEKGGVFKKIFR